MSTKSKVLFTIPVDITVAMLNNFVNAGLKYDENGIDSDTYTQSVVKKVLGGKTNLMTNIKENTMKDECSLTYIKKLVEYQLKYQVSEEAIKDGRGVDFYFSELPKNSYYQRLVKVLDREQEVFDSQKVNPEEEEAIKLLKNRGYRFTRGA